MKISNNTIDALLIVAVVLSLAGSLFSLNKLNMLSLKYDALTGALATNTSVATTALTVQSATAVYNYVPTIAFGSGYVHSTCSACGFDTFNGTRGNDGASVLNSTCCVSFNNVSSGFLLENVGNTNVTLNMSCTGSCNASYFLGNGTGTLFQFSVNNASNNGETNSSRDTVTDTATSCGPNGWNYSEWTDMNVDNNGVGFDLCGGSASTKYYYGAESTKDAVVVDLKVKFPSDIVTTGGAKTATITFKAESSG